MLSTNFKMPELVPTMHRSFSQSHPLILSGHMHSRWAVVSREAGMEFVYGGIFGPMGHQ